MQSYPQVAGGVWRPAVGSPTIDGMRLDDMIFEGRLGPELGLPSDRPFTTRMANEAGVTGRTLAKLVTAGLLRRPIKGVYLATEAGDSLALRAACLRLCAPEDAVVVDRHAGWLLGAEMILAPGEHLALRPVSLFLPAGRGRLRNVLSSSGERTFRPDDTTEIHGVRVTTPLRTAWDLGRVRWTSEAIAGLDAMHRLQAYEVGEFLDGIERFRGQRWVTTLRTIGPLADGRSESPPESILRLRCIEASFPVTPQVEVRRGAELLGRLDLGNEQLMAGVEYDGAEWHTSPKQLAHDRDRRTDLREAGWLIDAFTKVDLFGQGADPETRIRRLHRTALDRRGSRLAG